jgi:hypothetical protein
MKAWTVITRQMLTRVNISMGVAGKDSSGSALPAAWYLALGVDQCPIACEKTSSSGIRRRAWLSMEDSETNYFKILKEY